MRYFLILSAISLFLLTACADKKAGTHALYNEAAVLPNELLQNISNWKVISTAYDRTHKTMSVLYGNEAAVSKARTGGAAYPSGSTLCLVTWNQQDDQHWFGGRIPGNVKSAEWIRFDTAALPVYERYEGNPLQKSMTGDTAFAGGRIKDITSRRVLVIP